MPCSDGGWGRELEKNEAVERETADIRMKLGIAVGAVNQLSAMMCAILSELERQSSFDAVVGAAEESGKIKIREFWEKHKAQDVERLREKLNGFSEDEKSVMLKILKGELK